MLHTRVAEQCDTIAGNSRLVKEKLVLRGNNVASLLLFSNSTVQLGTYEALSKIHKESEQGEAP
jgi:hypothetical protein